MYNNYCNYCKYFTKIHISFKYNVRHSEIFIKRDKMYMFIITIKLYIVNVK